MNDAGPAPEVVHRPPTLESMLAEAKDQVRTMYGLSLKYERDGDPKKVARYLRKKVQLESVQHVLEALRHWMGGEVDDKQVWHVLAHCLKSPPPSVELAEALKRYTPPATTLPEQASA